MHNKDLNQTKVLILYSLPQLEKAEIRKYNLFFSVLGMGMSSKLFEKIRGELGLVYNIDAGISSMSNNYMADIYFSSSPSNIPVALKNIKNVLKECAEGNITEEELAKVKNKIITSIEFSKESNSGISRSVGNKILKYMKSESDDMIINHIKKITVQDLVQCAKNIYNSNNFVISAVGNCKKEDLLVYEN